MRRVAALLVACSLLSGIAAAGVVPLGRFAQPWLTGTGSMCNLDHNVVVERGFKLEYLARQRNSERWGASTFAGLFTVLINGDTPAYTLLKEPSEGTRKLLARPAMGGYAKEYRGEFGWARVTCEDAIGNPLAHLSAEFHSEGKPLTVEWLLTGEEWSNGARGSHWEWWSQGSRQVLTPRRDGAIPIPRRDGFLLAWLEGKPYTLALLPAARPDAIRISRQGVSLKFATGAIAASSLGRLPDLSVAALDAHPADSLLAILPELAQCHAELDWDVGWADESAFVDFHFKDGKRRPLVPVPPPFSSFCRDAPRQQGSLGPVAFVAGKSARLALPVPPNLERLVQDFSPLPAEEKAAVEADVRDILAHQKEDGQFTFSLKRPFYDGQTAGVLIQLAPLVDEPLRGQIISAVRKTLDYWWGRLQFDERTGVWVFPEPVMPSAVIDYPEISSTILYPTAAYAHLADRDYARRIWPKAAALAETIERAYDITGSAWAHAGPEYVHVLTESTVGGYLAYASLYHLAKLARETDAAAQFRNRACWAFAAMDLYRWREEYGKGGILSQYLGHGMYVEPQLAWDYTMFTWFSWCPLWSLPPGDPYHVFEVIKQQEWWLYWRDSRQLAYDFSHFLALVRFGDAKEGLAHWNEILTHTPSFDNFDTIALYRPIARAWRQLVLARTGRPQ